MPILPLALGFVFALISGAAGQATNSYNNPSGDLSGAGLAMPGGGASGTSKPSNDEVRGTDDETDPTLQRLRTKDSIGEMSRDEGQLTAKTRRREKVTHVESTKQLPTSGTDHKFQGSLLHSTVTAITDVAEKPNAQAEEKANAEVAAADQEDPRFRAKRLVFAPMKDDESKKGDSPRTKADPSPSPSPSASASASPSNR